MTRVLVATASGAIAASGAMVAAPAHAEGLVSACHWIVREYADSYTCADPAESVASMQIVECWKYPASPRTYVRIKTDAGWVPDRAITVKLAGNRGCSDPYPYRTVVTIPSTLLAEMTTTRVRMTLPATSGEFVDGTAYDVGKTVVTYGACLMPDDAGDWCPER